MLQTDRAPESDESRRNCSSPQIDHVCLVKRRLGDMVADSVADVCDYTVFDHDSCRVLIRLFNKLVVAGRTTPKCADIRENSQPRCLRRQWWEAIVENCVGGLFGEVRGFG